jgi:hypothetical protein
LLFASLFRASTYSDILILVTSIIPHFIGTIKLFIARIDFIAIIAKSARISPLLLAKQERGGGWIKPFFGKVVLADVNEGKKGEDN